MIYEPNWTNDPAVEAENHRFFIFGFCLWSAMGAISIIGGIITFIDIIQLMK